MYPKDLDEIPSHELIAELVRRRESYAKHICPYCKQSYSSHTCKFSGRGEGYRTQDNLHGGKDQELLSNLGI